MSPRETHPFRARFSPRRCAAAVLGLGLWIAASELLTPWITRATLRAGGAWEYALLLWLMIASRSAITAILFFTLLSAALSSTTFVESRVGAASPRALACIRIVVCSILLASVLWEHLPSTAELPAEMIQPMGVMKLLHAVPGFSALSRSAAALGVFQAATAVLLLLGVIGWRARLVLPLAAFAYLILGGILRQYSWFFHTGLVPLYVLFVVAMTPCADALSLDRRRRLRQGALVPDPAPDPRYGWSRYACWTALALPYFMAGLSKIRNGGAAWFEGGSLKSILLRDTLDPMEFDWRVTLRLADLPDGFFALMAVAAVASEIAYVSVLFSRRARVVVPALTALLHLGIWFLQNVLFFDLILLQLLFVDWDRLARRVRDLAAGPGASAARRALARPLGGGPSSTRDAAAPGGIPASVVASRIAAAAWAPRLRFMTGLLLFCWLALVEQYPFTAFQMYSGAANTGSISYLRVEAHYASGETARAPIERIFPALRDSRYRGALRGCFEPARRPACDALLEALLAADRGSDSPDALRSIEVQLRQSGLETPPPGPEYGTVTSRYRYPA